MSVSLGRLLSFTSVDQGNVQDISVLYNADANIPQRFDQRGKISGQKKDYSV